MKPDEPKTGRRYGTAAVVALAVIMVIDLFVHHHAHFENDGITVDTLPLFYPLLGFIACFLTLVVGRTLAISLSRKDTYYADD